MSQDYFAWAWKHSGVKEPARRQILMSIADQANDDGFAFDLSISKISDVAGTGINTTKRHIEELISDGLLAKAPSNGKANSYEILVKVEITTQPKMGEVKTAQPKNSPQKWAGSVLSIKSLSTKVLSIKDDIYTVPENSPEADPPQKAIGHFDPDIKEKIKPHKNKGYGKHDPTLFIFASEIAVLCSLSLGNGSKTECFKAAKTLLGGSKPPARPKELHPYFAKGGKIYREWPWSKGDRLKPMDIPKHWPRLSGSVKPPEVNQPTQRPYEEA